MTASQIKAGARVRVLGESTVGTLTGAVYQRGDATYVYVRIDRNKSEHLYALDRLRALRRTASEAANDLAAGSAR